MKGRPYLNVVFSEGDLGDRFWPHVQKTEGCWTWRSYVGPHGYGVIGFHRQNLYAHRVAWELTHGQIPKGQWVLHHCDNRACVNPSHLFLGDVRDNNQDMIQKGRHSYVAHWGEKNGFAKLDPVKVQLIRAKFQSGASQASIARDFSISPTTVFDIVTHRRWAHIP